ncbi:MAG TPA: Ig-like domain-containing protein, partial [Spirochaetota bacterium]
MKRETVLPVILAIAVLLISSNCNNANFYKALVFVPTEGFTLKSQTLIPLGETEILSPVFIPENATEQDIVWSSDNSAVATVDQSGTVTTFSKGTAVITATSTVGAGSKTCSVTVVNPTNIYPRTDGGTTTYILPTGTTFSTVDAGTSGVTFPTGSNDLGSATITIPFVMADSETTYRLWNDIKTWATSDAGYLFANNGAIGSTNTGDDRQPVTT